MVKTLKSPVVRIGGKGMISGWLREFIPEHVTYCEPFCGGASLLFSKEHSRVEVINDIDSHLIGFFNILKHPQKREKLINTLKYMPFCRKLWQEIRLRWKQGLCPADEVEKAARYFFLSKASFAGNIVRGGFACPSITGRNPAKTFRSSIENVGIAAERLKYVTIECLPYDEVIRRYDSPGTFFYIDPPYLTDSNRQCYAHGFTENNHYRLSELLHGIKGKAMVSHYASELYDTIACIPAGTNTLAKVSRGLINHPAGKSQKQSNAFGAIFKRFICYKCV
ncbi:MAG: DNA adenine methylase [Planctomycetes bacterium]|nr:DNA adenine methylase [Planctomycetota bacterium]